MMVGVRRREETRPDTIPVVVVVPMLSARYILGPLRSATSADAGNYRTMTTTLSLIN